MALVDASKDKLPLLRGILLKVESEYWLVDELLIDHRLEGCGDLVRGDALEAQTQQAVELPSCESDVQESEGDLAHLRKELALHVYATYRDSVFAEDALHRTGTILHLVIPSVLLVCLGLALVVPRVKVRSEKATGLTWHPHVRRSSVEDDLEVLAANLDRPVELRVLEVADGHRGTSRVARGIVETLR